MNKYAIKKIDENVLQFARDHGICYGGVKTTCIDTYGKTGRSLRLHLTKHLGREMSKAAAEAGFCD